jgi:alpha-L-rhamnosidase
MTGHALRVEHLDLPLGIHTLSPRLSWRLPSGCARQIGYRLRADNGWDTGRIDSGRSVLVPYDGPAPVSSQRVNWQVKLWTDQGEHDWSPWSWFEMGLLSPADWTAKWISPAESSGRPGYLLRAVFETTQPVRRARLHVTAHGIYEAFLNGVRVGDAELTPGFTQYRSRLQVQSYEVTSLINSGRSVIGVILADGWFRGQTGALRSADQWGTEIALLAQLEITLADGTTRTVGTGNDWRGAVGHVVGADLIAGESWDLRRLPRGWHEAGFDDSDWAPVAELDEGYDTLTDSPAPPVRRVAELEPVSVTELGPDRYVVDLGQNINGWIRIGLKGKPVRLTHAEARGAGGDVTTDHLRPDFPFLPEPLPAGMVDVVVPAGSAGESFEPRRTTHGFRFVRVEGQKVTADDVRGIVVHTDMRRTGWFACSDERINRLHEAAVWSFRDNACDIPTDCPQRERAGWTGDWQVFVPTAAFLYDVAGFSTKWLRDVAADQWADGTVANMSPCPPAEGEGSEMAVLHGSAGWGDAVVIVPWELYRAYGDERILAEMWPAMTAWIGRAARLAREQRHPERAAAPHDAYLWDSGFHWGEWLAPGDDPSDFPALLTADHGDVATAYLAHSAGLMARIATIIGEDPAFYTDLAARARDAWQREFIGPEEKLTPDTQANHVRALAFDLVPWENRAAAGKRLAQLVREADDHLATGFLATPALLPALADAGFPEVAYALLFQDATPSWLAMIDRGATTMWERWNGVDENGVPHESLNHYAKGAVISFLHRYTAGLTSEEPAYRTFRVQPFPGGGLTWAHATHDSPYGRIEVRWSLLTGGAIDLSVSVPPGTTATAVLPDGSTHHLSPGEHHITG